MQLRINDLDQIENDPSVPGRRNLIISPEDAEPTPVVIVEEGLSPADERERELNAILAADDIVIDEEEDVVDALLEEDEFGNQEISALSRQLDQLQSALDAIEFRNENIHKELLEILYSNREVRQTLGAENQSVNGGQDSLSTNNPSVTDNGTLPGTSSIADDAKAVNADAKELFKLVQSVTEKIDKL